MSYICDENFRHASDSSVPGRNLFFIDAMQYTNRPLTIQDQISRLQNDGLIISDVAKAESELKNISYFRLAISVLIMALTRPLTYPARFVSDISSGKPPSSIYFSRAVLRRALALVEYDLVSTPVMPQYSENENGY